jgi:hypothetical protein
MTDALLRFATSTHGHIGALAAVALLHPAFLLWGGRPATRGVRWTIGLATSLVILAYAMGIGLYADYRDQVKRALFREDAVAGFLFETKEHLAFVAVVLALGAILPSLLEGPDNADLRKLAARCWAGAALACWIVGGLGTWVESIRGF